MRVKLISKISAVCLAVLACVLLFGAGKTALAANPTTIDFQGKVVNSDGTNVTNGTYSFVFRIYNTASPSPVTACSGDATCLFEETQSSVTVTNGTFQVELGSTCTGGLVAANTCTKSAAGGLNFNTNSALYLTLQFNGDASGTHGGFMWPVIHLTSVPYAYYADNAGSLGGISSNNFVQFATGSLQADSSTNSSIAVNKTGASGDILLLQSNSKNALEVNNAGTTLIGQAGASGLNGTLTFNNAAGANTVSLSLQANPGSSYTLLLPTTGPTTSQCLQTDSTTANQLKFASCSGGSSSLATDYNSAATTGNTITLASTGGPLIVQDNSTPLTGSLFTVMGNACASSTCKYLDVTSSQITTSTLAANTPGSVAYNSLTSVDTSGVVGQYPSIAMGSDGYARIAYYDVTNGDLKYAQCTNFACTTKNLTSIDTTGTVGAHPSVAMGADGFARIAYYDTTNDDLKFAQCTNAACTTHNITTISSNGGTNNSIAMGADGFARIAYYDDSTGKLTFAQCTNAACTTNNITIVDSTVGTGNGGISLALGSDGFGRIAYRDASSGDLKFAQCTDATCLSSNINYVDLGANVVGVNSITMGSDGYARILYDDNALGVRFMQCTNAACTTQATNTVASGVTTASMTLGSDGFARIVYQGGLSELMFAQCTDAACSTKTTITVDSNAHLGGCSITRSVDGFYRIGYYDQTNGDLKFATRTTADSSAGYTVSGSSIGTAANYYGQIYAKAIDLGTFTVGADGSAMFKGSANSATAFQIQTAGGTDSLLTADTTNNKVIIGNSTGTDTATTLLVLDSSTADPTTGYNGAMYYNTTNNKYRCYINGAWADCAGSTGTFLAKNATDTSSANAGSGYLYTFTNSGSSGSGGVLSLDNGNNTGTVLNVSGTSTAAFRVQTASAADTLLTADSSANKVVIGNATGTNTSTTLLVLDSATTDPTTGFNGAMYYNTTSNAFRCYVNGAWANCTGVDSLSSSYNSASNSGNTITLTSPGGPMVVQDNSIALTGSLFTVMGNGCASSSCKYLDVSSTGIAVTGLTVNGNATIAAGDYLKITGSGTRPSSPTAGTLYYDTSTKALLTYNGTKWTAAPKSNTEIVAPSAWTNATTAQLKAEQDAADFVATGTDDGATINSALSALPSTGGGRVYLLPGTYTLGSTAISIPDNTTLEGSGTATKLTWPNSFGAGTTVYYAIVNSDTSTGKGVNIKNLLIDGNKTNQVGGNFNGIYFLSMGSSTLGGGVVSGVTIQNLYGSSYGAIYLSASYNNTLSKNSFIGNASIGIALAGSSTSNTLTSNTFYGNSYSGISLKSSSNNLLSGNTINADTNDGIDLDSSSNNNTLTGNVANSSYYGINSNGSGNTITGNTANSNNQAGIVNGGSGSTITGNTANSNYYWGINSGGSGNTITGNTANSNGTAGIYLSAATNTSVSANKLDGNGGSTHNNAIYLTSTSTGNSVANNNITDSSCSTDCYAINISDVGSTANYFSGNHFGFTTTTYIYNPNNDAETFDNQEINTNGDTIFKTNTSSSTAFQVQTAGGSAVLGVATSSTEANNYVGLGFASNINGRLLFNNSAGANTVTIQAQAVNPGSSFALSLPTALPGASNYCIVSSSLGVLSFLPCGASASATVTLSPEFVGAVMSGVGGTNTGTMTSDYCAGSSKFPSGINTSVCTVATDEHNYYSWTANAGNSYDIFVRWSVPQDFASFSSGSFNYWKTAAGDTVTMNVYSGSSTACATQSASGTTAAWGSQSITMTGCAPSAGGVMTVDIHLAVGTNSDFARIGEISLGYNRN